MYFNHFRIRLKKFLALTLVITMVVTYVPIESFAANNATDELQKNEIKESKPLITERKEDISKRTKNSRTYLNPDGTYTSEISQSPIHYKDTNNQWKEIKNSLVEDTNKGFYKNKANEFTVKFPNVQKSNTSVMQIVDNKHTSELRLEPLEHTNQEPAEVKGLVEGNSITYPNVYSNIDLKYSVGSDRIKEDIIYNEKPEEGFPSEFTFSMDLEGMYVKEKGGILYLHDLKTNEPLYYFEKPYMYDSFVPEGFKASEGIKSISEESVSYDVSLTYEVIEKQLYLNISPSKQWLEDSNRVYPITIDPTIVKIQSPTDIEDTNLRSAFPTQTGGNDLEIGGGASGGGVIRTLLKFDLSSIPAATTILSSSLDLWFSSTNNSSPIDISLFKVTKDWNENEASWNYAKTSPSTAWTNQGGDYVTSNKLATVSGLTSPTTLDADMKKWDIPYHIIQNWRNDLNTNYGFVLKSDTEGTNIYKKFVSSEHTVDQKYKPLLVVTYRTNARLGLEDYWMYDSHPLIDGTSYSNLTTDNNVIQYTDFSITGRGGFGLEFTRTYNSKSKESSAMGYGWTFTGNEKLFLNIKQTANILDYQDEDGTDHEFNYDITNAIYKSGPGKYLSIKKSSIDSNIYLMEDKYGTKTTFKILQASSDTDVKVAYIQSKEDRYGNRINYQYENNQLTSITSDLGNGILKTLRFTFNSSGYIETAEYEGSKFTYHYVDGKVDYVDQLKKGTINTRTTFKYKNGSIGTIIDPNGRLTDYSFDASGYLTKVQEPLDGKNGNPNDPPDRPGTVYDIDNINNRSSVTDPEGNITTYYFDSNYVPQKMETDGSSITYSLDSNYNPLTSIENGKRTINTFDSNGNLLSTTDPENYKESYTYTTFSRVATITDSNLNKTTYNYQETEDGEIVIIEYPDEKIETYIFDSFGDLKSVKHPDGTIENKIINYASNQTTITNTDPFGNVSKIITDSINNTETFTDGRGQSYILQYNDKNELVKVTDQKGKNTLYDFDDNGNLISIKNAKNKSTIFQYNGQNQLKQETNALGKEVKYEYDNAGNVLSILLPNGHTITNNYVFNKLMHKSANGTTNYDFSYDISGNLTSVKLNNNLIKSIYYNDDNTIDYITDRGNKLDYTDLGQMQTVSYTVGLSTTTLDSNLDSMNRILSIKKNGETNPLVSFGYHDGSLPSSVTFKNGSSIQMGYIKNRLDSYIIKNQVNNILDSYQYEYDQNNNITKIITNSGETTYKYDVYMNQLNEESLPDGSVISYNYDEVGNRIFKSTTQDSITNTILYEYNDANQLIKVGNQSYQYDDNGNLISDGSNTYVFNDLNQLVSIKNQSGETIASYSYDEDGKRISSTTTSGTINYFYDGDKVIYETDESNKILRDYTYNENDQPMTITINGFLYYYLYNHHGDVVALTDSAGNIVASYTYDAWGNILSQTGPLASVNPYRYAGYRYDENTKLYYLLARYYNSDNGVFLSPDPISGELENPVTQNKYIYAHNNPVMMVDPNGELAFLLPIAVILGEVAVAHLISISAAIIIAGVVYVSANTVVNKLKRKNPKHYLAKLKNGKLYIGNNVSKSTAASHLRNGGDVWSRSSSLAWDVANSAGKYSPTKAERQGTGSNYYWHYHARDKAKKRVGGHSFY